MFARTLMRAAAAAIASALLAAGQAGAWSWDERYFPNHTVYDQDGNAYSFYDDLVRGKIVVANFVYTTCTDICGLSTARMAEVIDNLGERIGKEIFVYSISLTPEIDTPEQLKKFATAFGEVEGWKFLTGDPEEIKEIRWKLGERSRFLGEHRSDMVMGNDNKGYWRRISLMGNLANVTDEILSLDPKYAAIGRTRPASPGDRTRYAIGQRPGEGLFQKGCSGCHKIGGGDRIGPDLYDISSKREPAWLMRVLTEPKKLRAEGDPLFAELDARYPNVLMPDLDLGESDARDVLEYIRRRSAELRAERAEAAHGHGHESGSHEAHSHEDHTQGAHSHLQDAHDHSSHSHEAGAHDHGTMEPPNG